jgi:hypothetical protein
MQQQQLISSHNVSTSKNQDYFSSILSSSYISPLYNTHGVRTNKRHSSLNQLFPSSSLSAISPGGSILSTQPELPTRQLQSLDYLNSRRNSLGPFSPSTYQRGATYTTEKYNIIDSLQPNTLPPISLSPLLQDQPTKREFETPPPLSHIPLHEPPKTTSASPAQQSRGAVRSNVRFQSLSTLDSFEASIMETLSFDNKSEYKR